mmetsp:Transcript_21045/g.31189  ORF Transcript_21045/g.31189 Transcript_21045/m.31189 type:complete len:361 (+) Transcript_21045:76-1158(+)
MKWIAAALTMACAGAFAPNPMVSKHPKFTTTSLGVALNDGDQVMLIGAGFLQLVLAKTCKAAGLTPLIVAPQTKLDSFKKLVEDDDIMKDGTIGMPEVGEDQFGNIAAIVFCAEDAILPASYIRRVLDYQDKGQSAFVEGGLKKVVLCAPLQGAQNKEKSMGWIPIFNNDNQKDKVWDDLVDAYTKHPVYESDNSSLVRFGGLLGGSVDGPECIKELGISEQMYQMSLEQFRDMKERGFDRYKLGAQILPGNSLNNKPPNQDKMETEALKKSEWKEAFIIVDGYPEIDRANRHTVAQAIVQSLIRDDGSCPKEMTVLSKSSSQFPSDSEWHALFENPGPAAWPDPFKFDYKKYVKEEEKV